MNKNRGAKLSVSRKSIIVRKLMRYVSPPHFSLADGKIIYEFYRNTIVSGNILVIAQIVILRIIGRVLSILSFSVAMKAVIAALRPDLVLAIFSKLTRAFNMDVTLEYSDLPGILVVLILVVNALSWIVDRAISKLGTHLNLNVLHQEDAFGEERTMADDFYLITRVPKLAQSLIRCADTFGFILIMALAISIFSPNLALLMLPLLAAMVVIHVVGDRSKLSITRQLRDAKRRYAIIKSKGTVKRRESPEAAAERDSYINLRERISHRDTMKSNFDAFIGVVALCVIMLYLFKTRIDVGDLASLLIIFIFAIRKMLRAGEELSSEISKILELRVEVDQLAKLTRGFNPPLVPKDTDNTGQT